MAKTFDEYFKELWNKKMWYELNYSKQSAYNLLRDVWEASRENMTTRDI